MNLRSLVVWCVFVALAVINGVFREVVLTPRLGEHESHVIGTITLCTAILIVTWLTIDWMRLAKSTDALLIGGVWVLMTIAFEFLVGHYLSGSSWVRLLSDYDLLGGRVWLLVLATLAFAPPTMARARNVV
jgi:hypothetical protein